MKDPCNWMTAPSYYLNQLDSLLRRPSSIFAKVPMRFFRSHSYLTGVSAAKLGFHLPNMNMIFNRKLVFWWSWKTEINNAEEIDLVTAILFEKHTSTITAKFPAVQWVNSLWPSDAIWWHRSGSTLAQVMPCCLMAPSHYLNQCWLIISEVI